MRSYKRPVHVPRSGLLILILTWVNDMTMMYPDYMVLCVMLNTVYYHLGGDHHIPFLAQSYTHVFDTLYQYYSDT